MRTPTRMQEKPLQVSSTFPLKEKLFEYIGIGIIITILSMPIIWCLLSFGMKFLDAIEATVEILIYLWIVIEFVSLWMKSSPV